MIREIREWHSPRLNKKMEIVRYGHHGFAILLFPSAAADFLEYERFHLIDAIKPFIDKGICKVYSINSINSESWMNSSMTTRDKAIRHEQYNGYITEEVVPFIHTDCNGLVPIVTSGVSLGAHHAANSLFRRPDIFSGTIAMSGTYDLKLYTGNYWDDNCYFNSPVHYLRNLGAGTWLPQLQSKRHIYFMTGQGPYEHAPSSIEMGAILGGKGIPNYIDVWGKEWSHDWPTWRAMMPSALERWF